MISQPFIIRGTGRLSYSLPFHTGQWKVRSSLFWPKGQEATSCDTLCAMRSGRPGKLVFHGTCDGGIKKNSPSSNGTLGRNERWTLELRIPSLAMSCLTIWHDVGRVNVGDFMEATFPLQDPVRRNVSRESCTRQQSKYTTKHIDALVAGTGPKVSYVSSFLRQRAEGMPKPAGLNDGAQLSSLASR